MFSDNPHRVYIDDFGFDRFDRFTYEYNFFAHWLVDTRIESIDEAKGSQLPIYCVRGNGIPGAEPYDEFEATLNLLKALAKADKTTTIEETY